jgi:vacuolar-type H+-ATPase subunit I/STV1
MKKIKTYICIGVVVLIASLVTALVATIKSKNSIEKEWKNAIENVKAYSEQYSTSESKNRAFKLTVEQLEESKDSIFQELDETRNELKIKDSKLQSLQYVSSSFAKTDTIVLKDTLFKNSQVELDTLLSDEWYSMRVGLKYPSTIAVSPMFKSEKNIIVSTKKETIKPAKKFFLLRWFQRKQTVLNINIVEKNPYMQSQDNRYVEIIR